MPSISSDKASNKARNIYEEPMLTTDMKGQAVTTKHGHAIIISVITSKQLLHIRYIDGSIGWVGVGQFELNNNQQKETPHGKANERAI